MPSPVGGMDARQNLARGDLNLCIYSYNLNASEYGLTVRDGYSRYQTEARTATGSPPRTLIPFAGDPEDGSKDRLYAANSEGIWDVSDEGAAPVQVVTFATESERSGYGVYAHYTTDAEEEILFYADAENGLYRYDASTDAWTVPTGITGVDVADINYIVVHKLRIWFGIKDSSTGYYLGVKAVAGAAAPFSFGSMFKHGGDLVGLYNWTIDGGDGLDDYLIAVSRGGDVIPFRGDDPEDTTWEAVGVYFIGQIPVGNKINADLGGELALLSEFGITSMSDLIRSSTARDPTGGSLAYKIARLLRADLQTYGGQYGWEMRYAAAQGQLIIKLPKKPDGQPDIQYMLTRTTGGWCIWRDLPMSCIDTWRGKTYFGSHEGNIEQMGSPRDGIIPDTASGQPINFSLLTNFSTLGEDGLFKRCEMIRPSFTAQVAPTYGTAARYDYQFDESAAPPIDPTPDGAVWDSALWDDGLWASSIFAAVTSVRGSLGMGRAVGVALAGQGEAGTYLISMDVMWRSGWML